MELLIFFRNILTCFGHTNPGGDAMYYRRSDTDRYGDGDVPEADDKPYQDNDFEPHPQTDGEN